MHKNFGLIALVLALLLVGGAYAEPGNNNGNNNGNGGNPNCNPAVHVTFCHVDEETGPATITIDECGYLQGHKNHRLDSEGACPATPPEPVCGDGAVNQNSEQCDDGNTVTTDACSNTCTYNRNVCTSESTTVINEDTTTWFFWDENAVLGTGKFVIGPATPPAGTGSANLIASAAGSRKLLSTDSFRGTKLRDITSLKYSTYNDASTQDGVTATLQFDIDTDSTDANTAWQGRLVYEPLYSHTVSEGTWQEWDTLDDVQPGSWWFSKTPGSDVCPQGNPCTWSEVLAAFPNAAIRDTGAANSGLTHLKAGGPVDINTNVDKLVLGVRQACATYDLEHKIACGDNIKEGTEECDGTDVTAGNTCTAECALQPLPKAVRPIFDCVRNNNDGTYTAFFSHLNENAAAVTIPVGEENKFTPAPQDRGQPIEFSPGRSPYYPGSEFNATFDGNNLVWTLKGPNGETRTATASKNGAACPAQCGNGVKEGAEACDGADGVTAGYTCTEVCALAQLQKVSPVLECVEWKPEGQYTARFGYNNPNSVDMSIALGGSNKFTPAPENRGQPTTFIPGRQRNAFTVDFDGSNLVWSLNGKTSTASNNPAQRCQVCGDTYKDGTEECDTTAPEGYTCTQECTLQEVAPTCGLEQLSIVSDTTNTIIGGGNAAATWAHPAWSASIPGATWIWSTQYVEHPDQDEVRNFTKTITVPNAVQSATLDIASDNTYTVWINGILVAQSAEENNFQAGTQDSYVVTSALHSGPNTIVIEVKNNAYTTTDPMVNPAGLLYKLAVTQDTCLGPQPWCGDLIKNGEEACDAQDGIKAGQQCTSQCTLQNVCTPDAQLLSNGDFETPVVESSQQWDLFPQTAALGWSILWTNPSEANPVIELQSGVLGAAHSGSQYAELDSNAPTTIFQDIPTVPGQNYTVSFSFSPRPNTGAGDNVLELRIGGAYVDQISAAGTGSIGWTRHTYEFQATSETTRIEFVDLGAANSLGTFIDNAIVACTPGPLPACGDGIINQRTEQCDLTAGVGEHYTCTASCTLQYVPYCGDGNVDAGEQCDLTNGTPANYACTNACALEKTCQDTKDMSAPYAATRVVEANQGKEYDGQAVKAIRSNANTALTFQSGRNEANFFALGFGGNITVEFEKPIQNGPGKDVRVIEDTWGGSYPREAAAVYASDDGTTWTLLGIANNSNMSKDHTLNDFDLGALAQARYIKVVDVSSKADFATYASRNDADGFDLNGVLSLQDHTSCVSLTCEQAIAGGLLYATISGGSAVVHNDAQVPFTVTAASYKMYASSVEDQTLHDSATMRVTAGDAETLNIAVPACGYQLDVVCGEAKIPPTYSAQETLNFSLGNQNSFCAPEPRGSVSLSVAPYFPQGGDYTFICSAEGFVPTKYFWYYGDGDTLPDTALSSTFHRYEPGTYTVGCTATDGTNSGTGVMQVTIEAPPACVPSQTVRIFSNESVVMLGEGELGADAPAVLAWQPYDGQGNTYWDTSIDRGFTYGKWIWSSQRVSAPVAGEKHTFKKDFTLSGTPTAGRLYMTVDNAYEVRLNGEYVGGGQASGDWQNSDFSEPFVHTFGWQSVENYDVTDKLESGLNTLVIVAANERMDVPEDAQVGTIDLNPAGVIFELEADVTNDCGAEEEPEQPVCEEYQLAITSTTPETVLVGDVITVSGTLSDGSAGTSGSVVVNGEVASVLMNQWSVDIEAPQTPGSFTITAIHTSACGEQTQQATATAIVDVEPLAPVEQSANETQMVFRSSDPGGYCITGWHREDGDCVKDLVPVAETESSGDEDEAVYTGTPEWTSPADDDAPSTKKTSELPHPADKGNWLTGNVLGAGIGASWVWLAVLLGVVLLGFGSYKYAKRT